MGNHAWVAGVGSPPESIVEEINRLLRGRLARVLLNQLLAQPGRALAAFAILEDVHWNGANIAPIVDFVQPIGAAAEHANHLHQRNALVAANWQFQIDVA